MIAESVLATVRGYSADDRREVVRLLGLIQAEPWIDNRAKIALLRPPAVYTVYVSPRFWIVYHMIDSQTINVVNVGRAGISEPAPW